MLDEADREVGLVAVPEGDRRVRGEGEAAHLDVVAVVVGVEADLLDDGFPRRAPGRLEPPPIVLAGRGKLASPLELGVRGDGHVSGRLVWVDLPWADTAQV